MNKINKNDFFSKYVQTIINVFLGILTVLLLFLLFKETSLMVEMTITSEYDKEFYKEFLKSLLTFFLYFEFISMIIKYFKENYHFPLRYFMYIGITANIRVIIVDHDNGLQTLYFSLSIAALVLSYFAITMLTLIKKKWKIEN